MFPPCSDRFLCGDDTQTRKVAIAAIEWQRYRDIRGAVTDIEYVTGKLGHAFCRAQITANFGIMLHQALVNFM